MKINNWEKIKPISAIIASIFIPITVLIIGNWHSSAFKESETRVRYIELAVDILKEEPSNKNFNIRNWAVELIKSNSEIELNTLTKNELLSEPLLNEVDEFIKEEYIPIFLKNFFANPEVIPFLTEVIQTGDKSKIIKQFSDMIIAANKQIEIKRNELKSNQVKNKMKN